MPYVENRGAKIYWTERGSGPPVLLIMGLSFTHEMWFRVLPWITEGYRAILFDNRGMGRSDVPKGPYSMSQLAEDAMAVLDAAQVPAAHVIGASMGGMISQEIALRYPERVLSLLLGCTSYGGLFARWPDLSRRPRKLPLAQDSILDRELAIAPLLYADATPYEKILEDIQLRCTCAWTYKGFWNQFAGIVLWNSYLRLPRIKIPTLVVHGDEDRLIPPQNGKVVASRIPGARLEIIRGAGHILTTDQPEICAKLLVDFLDEQVLRLAEAQPIER
jgi:3-oxoadipate enol-lactonase